MKKFKFIVQPYYAVAVDVCADSYEEAKEMLRDAWQQRKIEECDDNNYQTEIIDCDEFSYDIPDYRITENKEVVQVL